eukprot:665726-Hanusia_phi.AAC.1
MPGGTWRSGAAAARLPRGAARAALGRSRRQAAGGVTAAYAGGTTGYGKAAGPGGARPVSDRRCVRGSRMIRDSFLLSGP